MAKGFDPGTGGPIGTYDAWGTEENPFGNVSSDVYGPGENPWGAFVAPVTNEANAIFRDDPAAAMVQALNRSGSSGNLNSPIYRRMMGLAPGLATLYEVMGGQPSDNSMEGAVPWLDQYLGALTAPMAGYGGSGGVPTFGDVSDMFQKVVGGNAPGLLGEFFGTAAPDDINTEILRMAQAAGYTGMGRLALQGMANSLAQKAMDYRGMGSAAEEALGPYLNYLKGTLGGIL